MLHLTTKVIGWDRVAYLQRASVQDGCGAVVTFVGVVRADRDGRRTVRALFYDAYPEMAESLIHQLVDEARARWTLDGAQLQHRLGVVEAGQVSVVVAVAAQHRAEAYAASQFLLEGIKHHAPIWKRELYEDGASRWVTCSPTVAVPDEPLGAVHAHV